MTDVPGPHLRHLVSHLAQHLGRAQDVATLLPGAQLAHFASFIQYLPDGLLPCISCRNQKNKQKKKTHEDTQQVGEADDDGSICTHLVERWDPSASS